VTWPALTSLYDRFEPARIGGVVGEDDDLPQLDLAQREVERAALSGLRLVQDSHGQPRGELPHDVRRGVRSAIVDHDEFDFETASAHSAESLQRFLQDCGAVPCRNQNCEIAAHVYSLSS
jgi:hypothetical protein